VSSKFIWLTSYWDALEGTQLVIHKEKPKKELFPAGALIIKLKAESIKEVNAMDLTRPGVQ